MNKIVKVLSTLFLFSCILTTTALAALGNLEFSWIPNAETNIAGYKIHYGTSSDGIYPYSVDVNNIIPNSEDGRIHGSVNDLVVGITYYFVCTAYNASGKNSDFSNRVVAAAESDSPTIIHISIE